MLMLHPAIVGQDEMAWWDQSPMREMHYFPHSSQRNVRVLVEESQDFLAVFSSIADSVWRSLYVLQAACLDCIQFDASFSQVVGFNSNSLKLYFKVSL